MAFLRRRRSFHETEFPVPDRDRRDCKLGAVHPHPPPITGDDSKVSYVPPPQVRFVGWRYYALYYFDTPCLGEAYYVFPSYFYPGLATITLALTPSRRAPLPFLTPCQFRFAPSVSYPLRERNADKYLEKQLRERLAEL